VKEISGGWPEFILVAVCLGGLGFLNTWDFPIYLAVMSIAIAAARAQVRETNWARETLATAGGLGLLGVGLYAPFYVGFQSQVGGLLPNLFNPTKVQQFLVFFGPFLFAIVGYLILISNRQGWRLHWKRLPPLLLAIVGAPIVAMLTIVGVAAISPALRPYMDGILYDPHMRSLLSQPSVGSLVLLALRLHLGNPLTWLLLSGLLIWIGLMWPSPRSASDYPVRTNSLTSSDRFVLLITSFGLALPLIVEFVYLRDNFGIRMNTVFKFYYQSWILLAVSAAYGIWAVHMRSLRAEALTRSERRSALWQPMLRGLWELVVVCLVLAGLVYPILSIPSKVAHYEDEPQLDGMEWLSKVYPGDYAAIRWLQANVPGEAVILEAPGDRYAAYDYVGRISALTGLATLLGWGNHEHQWRGSYEIPARREPEIEALFNGLDPTRITALLDQYDIAYVYVGTLERKRYRADGLAKFEQLMEAIYRQGDVVIYQRR
jgi:YYY domain-containing protein